MEQVLCQNCHFVLQPNFYFCPNCGKNVKPAPLSTSFGKQIGIYALSIFLPPLGLWPGIKYLLQKNPKAKIIGVVAIVLTILSAFVTIWYTVQLMDQVNNQINSQLNMYNSLQ